ncbi:MAG: 16S rRNA (adenine(1518)-N(6)/adenine(1519)-N(6))-dimethyltransferase RsmA [Candidatus Hydrogenedentota bacterium]
MAGSTLPLAEVTRRHNITFRKGLGQNLLLDENINRIMVEAAALTPEDAVVEVGAGLGALTARLAERAGKVLAVEIDPRFMPVLEERFAGVENVVLFRGDVLNHDPDKLVEEFLGAPTRLKMVSNLPYYITTPLLFHFWESPIFFERIVVMVQEEVGHRMTSAVNTHDYGVLALAARYYSDVDIVHHVPRTCFAPRPKVDSCIVRLRNRAPLPFPEVGHDFLFALIHAAFAKRRKTLRNTLVRTPPQGVSAEAAEAAFAATGIDPSRRPQTLSLEDFAALARAMMRHGGATPQ